MAIVDRNAHTFAAGSPALRTAIEAGATIFAPPARGAGCQRVSPWGAMTRVHGATNPVPRVDLGIHLLALPKPHRPTYELPDRAALSLHPGSARVLARELHRAAFVATGEAPGSIHRHGQVPHTTAASFLEEAAISAETGRSLAGLLLARLEEPGALIPATALREARSALELAAHLLQQATLRARLAGQVIDPPAEPEVEA